MTETLVILGWLVGAAFVTTFLLVCAWFAAIVIATRIGDWRTARYHAQQMKKLEKYLGDHNDCA